MSFVLIGKSHAPIAAAIIVGTMIFIPDGKLESAGINQNMQEIAIEIKAINATALFFLIDGKSNPQNIA